MGMRFLYVLKHQFYSLCTPTKCALIHHAEKACGIAKKILFVMIMRDTSYDGKKP